LSGYHIPPELKLQIARSHAASEKALVRQSIDLIFTHKPAFYREAMNLAQSSSGASRWRLKVGYVSANIKSKTTVYMAQDLFRFHNRERFEIHVYATTPGDSDYFLENAMGGVDWRAKVILPSCSPLPLLLLYDPNLFSTDREYGGVLS
jgi:hypothetical protein